MNWQQLIPPANERSILVGTTGCGKTTLAKKLLSWYQNVAVFDIKGRIDWPGYTVYTSIQPLVRASELRLVYRPDGYELADYDAHELFFRWVYLRENTVCYVDEVFGICNGATMPPSYHAILTRGRELNIGSMNATQRPVSIPKVLKTETEHRYIFRLKDDNDRAVANDFSNVSVDDMRVLPKHQFYYSNDSFEVSGPLKLAPNFL